jgi:hypothetical protein
MTAAVALVAAVVSAWGGCRAGGSGQGNLRRQVDEAAAKIAQMNMTLDARQKNLERQAQEVASLEAEVQKLRTGEADRNSSLASERAHLAAENDTAKKQVVAKDATIQFQDRQIQQLKTDAAARQAEVNRLKQALERRAPPRSDVISWTGDPGSQGVVVSLNGGNASAGKVRGGLPGFACDVKPVDPSQVSLLAPPSQADWKRMTFRVRPNGRNTTVHFYWVAR